MQKIVPHLWFDKEADEAAEFYTSLFKDSAVTNKVKMPNTPSGTVEIVTITLSGQEFMLLSAGPYFRFTPAVSFLVACETQEEVQGLWDRLVEGGSALMPLDSYPFSEKYGWLEDKYGLSWQLMFMGDRKITQKITPTLMFVGKQCGKAEQAIQFYASVFDNAQLGDLLRYGPGEEPDKPGTVRHASFTLEGHHFAAMDSAHEHKFAFNEAISLLVYCDTQEEIDYYWDKLSADPQAEQCGWLKDQFGFSWQVVPRIMDEMMQETDSIKSDKFIAAMLSMKKFDIAELKKALLG